MWAVAVCACVVCISCVELALEPCQRRDSQQNTSMSDDEAAAAPAGAAKDKTIKVLLRVWAHTVVLSTRASKRVAFRFLPTRPERSIGCAHKRVLLTLTCYALHRTRSTTQSSGCARRPRRRGCFCPSRVTVGVSTGTHMHCAEMCASD